MSRVDEIHRLLTEELTEQGIVESADVVRHWMALVSVFSADNDGEWSNVYRVDSDPAPKVTDAIGMTGETWMRLQAIITATFLSGEGDE